MHTADGSSARLVLLLASVWAAAGPSSHAGTQNITINTRDDDGPLERCDQIDVEFDHRAALRDEEVLQVPVGGEALRVNLVRHGGIALTEGSANQHEIRLCKAVPENAGDRLGAIHASVQGSAVEVTGPAGQWVGYLIVRSPKGSRLELNATNGPIGVEDFEGRLTVTTVNGPIGLGSVTGEVSARAENGPIKLRSSGGHISLETENGPIAVRLVGEQWRPGQLVARADNGPLALSIPASYRSGVEVESSGNAPWKCRAWRGCSEADASSGTRRARFGDGPTRVRLSTVNGPVKVDQARD